MYPSPPLTVMGMNKKAPETMWQLSQYDPTLKSATRIVFSWGSGSSIRLTKYLHLFEQVIPWNFIQTTPILSLCIFLPCSLGSIKNVCVLTKKIINDKKSYRVVNNFFCPASACTCLWYCTKSQQKKLQCCKYILARRTTHLGQHTPV